MAAAPPADPVPDGRHLPMCWFGEAAHPAAPARTAPVSAIILDTMSAAGAGVVVLHPGAIGGTRGA